MVHVLTFYYENNAAKANKTIAMDGQMFLMPPVALKFINTLENSLFFSFTIVFYSITKTLLVELTKHTFVCNRARSNGGVHICHQKTLQT